MEITVCDVCDLSKEYITAHPTETSDRECRELTQCVLWEQYISTAATPTTLDH